MASGVPFALAPLAFPFLLLATAASPADLPAPAETLRLDAPAPSSAPDDAPRSLRLPRAGLELAGVLALGAAWYEAEIDFNGRDFDFERTWSSQWTKLVDGRGYRFDDNDRTTNIAHAFVGRTYHGVARTNHATMWQAVLFDLTASSLWESCIESQEVFSINDTIVTGIGGISLGESAFQLGELFARSAPTWRNRLLLALFSPARAFLALTEGGPQPKAHS